MKTLIIKRPKEKYYSEVDIKIFIDNIMVEKIGSDEIKEIEIDGKPFEIKAKSRGGYQSKTVSIDPSDINELEVIANTEIGIPPLLIFSAAMPLFIFAMNREKLDVWTIIIYLLFATALIATIVQFFRIRRKGILINTIK